MTPTTGNHVKWGSWTDTHDAFIGQRVPPPPGQEHPYHTMFPDISRRTLEVVVDTVKTRGLWTLPQDQGFELLRSMYAQFSQEYGMPTPRLHQDSYEFCLVPAEDMGPLPRAYQSWPW